MGTHITRVLEKTADHITAYGHVLIASSTDTWGVLLASKARPVSAAQMLAVDLASVSLAMSFLS